MSDLSDSCRYKFKKYYCIKSSVALTCKKLCTGLLVAHFENTGFYIGSSYSKYRLFTGFSIKNIG